MIAAFPHRNAHRLNTSVLTPFHFLIDEGKFQRSLNHWVANDLEQIYSLLYRLPIRTLPCQFTMSSSLIHAAVGLFRFHTKVKENLLFNQLFD